MSMYSNQLQPALQNLLQRVVWFLNIHVVFAGLKDPDD